MVDILSSDMPGVEEFEGMEMEELGESLPRQGAPGEEPRTNQTNRNDSGQRAESKTTGGNEQKVEQAAAAGQLDPKPNDTSAQLDAKIAALENTIQQMRRENRSTQALQSKVDRLENELKARSAAANPPLSPEQQAIEDQQQQAKKFLKEFFGQEMPTFLEEKYGHIIKAIERQEGERNQAEFKTAVERQCEAMGIPFKEVDPIFGKLLTADAQAYETDPAARARMDRIFQSWDPNELILRAVAERSKGIQAQGAKVQQQQAAAADKGGRALKPTGAKPADSGKRTLADVEAMSDEERDDIPLEELEALVPRQKRR